MDTNISPRFILVHFLFLFLKNHLSLGADTIFANQSLSGDQTIISAHGIFELGFFRPGNSLNYYIGMWYKQVAPQTIVWVANRDKPISNRFSSELRISYGNLVFFNEFKDPVWSTNVNFTSSPLVQVVLLDDGNLVLNDGSNLSKPFWESFDYRTDTWLPGSKLGYNRKTKTMRLLTSWKNPEDPVPGLFSFELDPTEESFIILWNMSIKHWSGGAWNGHIFSLVPEMRLDYTLGYSFVSNDNEIYFTYSVASTSTSLTRFVLDVSGQIKQLNWFPSSGWNLFWSKPRQECVQAFCGAYGICNENSLSFCNCLMGFKPNSQSNWDLKDYSGGCIRKTQLHCGNNNLANGVRDRFLEMSSMSFPEYNQSLQAGSFAECESRCLDDCSCTAYAFDNNGCSVWTVELVDLQVLAAGDTGARTLYIRLAASEFRSHKTKEGKIIGVVVGSVAGLGVFLGLILFYILRRRKKTGTRTLIGGSMMVFGYRDLQNATRNFSEKLGRGGFGSVFKGVLADSTVVAVKKLESVSQGEKQFRAEVSTI